MNERTPQGRVAEWFAALLLGIAALLSAYATMRSAIIGDEVLEGFTLSSQHYNEGNLLDDANTQAFVADQNLFLRYVEATVAGDEELSTYLTDALFSDELRTAVDWWEQEQARADAPESPFADGTPYRFEGNPAAAFDRGDAAFDAAKRADQRNDRFDQASALLAVTLFGAGLATLIPAVEVRRTLLAIALSALFTGIVFIGLGEVG